MSRAHASISSDALNRRLSVERGRADMPARAMLLEPSSLLIWPTQFTIEKHFLAEPSCPGKVSASSWQVLGISLLFGVRPGHFLAQGPPQTLPEPSPNPPKSSLEPSKTLFLKEISFKKAQEGLSRSFWGPKWSTWLHLRGPRPSQIEAKTSKNRC